VVSVKAMMLLLYLLEYVSMTYGVLENICFNFQATFLVKLVEVLVDSILLDCQVPTVYTRLLQGYDTMNPDEQSACSYAAKQLRLMVCSMYTL
jgi:hypothetical protein